MRMQPSLTRVAPRTWSQARFGVNLLLATTFMSMAATWTQAAESQLWGQAGERWTPQSRLPDFAFAGYRRGEEPFRIPARSISVSDFGAKGDGKTDDTAAFKQAIAAGTGCVVNIPAGRFLLSDVLEIQCSNLVLRGAGSSKTVLLFTKSLEQLRPKAAKTDGNQPTTSWSWGGGLIMIRGAEPKSEALASIVEPAARGANRITINQALFKAGDEIVVSIQDDPGKSLVNYLYHDQTGDSSGLNNWKCRQVFRVRSIKDSQLTLDRGLRFDVRLEWQPTVRPFQPAVTDVGLEGVAFEFAATPYAGHFKEVGFNPVEIDSSAAHCWLKDLRVWNADNGPFIKGTFCTIDGIRIGADPQRQSKQGTMGHHGITMYGHDCLCTHFSLETQFIHDLTVQSAMGCVFCSGKAVNLNMDHHRWAPYENLFTDIDAGAGTRLFASSGGGNRGKHSAAGATFWNLRATKQIAWPKDFGPDQINLIALPVREKELLDPAGRWLETIPPGQIQPANLYSAMRQKRLKQGVSQ